MSRVVSLVNRLAARGMSIWHGRGKAQWPKSSWQILGPVDRLEAASSVDIYVVGTSDLPRAQVRRLVAALEASESDIVCGLEVAPSGSVKKPIKVVAAGYEVGADPDGPVLLPLMEEVLLRSSWAGITTRAPVAGGSVAVKRELVERAVDGGWTPADGLAPLIAHAALDSECVVVWSVITEPSSIPASDALSGLVEARRVAGLGATLDLRPVSDEDPGIPAPPPASLWHGEIHHKRAAGRDTSPLRPAVAIRHAATDWAVAERWGDHHFAEGLSRALERSGIGARIVPHHAWSHPFTARDLVVTLRGLHPSTPVPGRINVLWLISHPAEIAEEELDAHDLIAVASVSDTARIRALTTTPVMALLQATDWDRFNRPISPGGDRLVFVGNSRDVRRQGVMWAVSQGLEPVISGAGWEGILPQGTYGGPVSNADLPDALNDAGVVLADHWDDMRSLGYVSNRPFDALAAGTMVVSDDVAGLDQILPGLPVYSGPEQLAELVGYWLDPGHATERVESIAALQALVRTKHTFDRRASELMAGVGRLVPGGEALVASLSDPGPPA